MKMCEYHDCVYILWMFIYIYLLLENLFVYFAFLALASVSYHFPHEVLLHTYNVTIYSVM